MRDRRPTRRPAALLAGVTALALLVLLVPAAIAEARGPVGGQDRHGSYAGSHGRLDYQVHLPPSWRADRAMPVVVAVHGCGMTGSGLNSMRAMTGFDDLADREGFIVVYPTQSILRNAMMCWNSLSPEHQQRGRGEPELLAGAIRQVVEVYGADPARVHVAGASSGAGSAVILGVTYPDLVATVTSVAGGEYRFHRFEEDPTLTPVDTARLAQAEMGPRARQVPLLVVQGDRDEVVRPFMADRLVRQWQVLGALVATGRPDADTAPGVVTRVEPPDGHPSTRTVHRAPGPGGRRPPPGRGHGARLVGAPLRRPVRRPGRARSVGGRVGVRVGEADGLTAGRQTASCGILNGAVIPPSTGSATPVT